MKRILVPTSSLVSAYEAADYVAQVASILHAEVHVLHVFEDEESRKECSDVFQMFEMACEENDIKVRKAVAVGSIVDEINRYAEAYQVNLVLMGASNGLVVDEWLSHKVLGHSTVPVLVMPYEMFEFPIEQPELATSEANKSWSISGLFSAWRS